MEYITKKYINLIGNRLIKFNWKNNNLAVCRCPLCGDSKKNKRKARGNFYSYKGEDFYNCYNCGEPQGFSAFLYNFDRGLYREYKLEKFQTSVSTNKKEDTFDSEIANFKSNNKPSVKPNITASPLDKHKRLSELPESHPARSLASLRALDHFFDSIYYIKDFPEFTTNFEGLESWRSIKKHPRLVFPCYSKNNELIGFSARALLEDQIRYCTWKDKGCDYRVMFGLDRVDESKTVYIVEGAIDSLMIDNAVAVMSSALNSIDTFNDYVVIFDNQPRNAEIIKLIKKTIDENKKVVVWPKTFLAKDLNEAVVDYGFSKEELIEMIKNNTFSGLAAKLKFNQWRKI